MAASEQPRMPFAVPKICFGAAPLGDVPGIYGYSVDAEQAMDTVRAIFDGPEPFLDTSRSYGLGRSEERIGAVIRERGGLPDGFVLSTKLDRDMETGRFDAARARRSLEESLSTLGLDRVQILHLHDPEYAADLQEVTRSGGAIDELFKMKEEGLADAVGLAMGQIGLMSDILFDWPFDAMITHNRLTLVNRQADDLVARAHDQGIAVFNAAPHASGVLAKGADANPRYVYQQASEANLEPVRAIEGICARYDVPLGAAALQFSLRERRVASTICGVTRPERVTQTVAWANWPIPEEAWEALYALPYSVEDPEANRTFTPE